MYPARKHADTVHSGTGVFYQAMPAVGADGKNIMKLIPVQMVNGKFVQTQISKPKKDPKPQKAVTIKVASAPVHEGKTTQQIVREQVSLKNALPSQTGVTECLPLGNSLNLLQEPQQQQTLNFTAKEPLMARLSTNHGKSVRLPVTVKSPALPRGQYLQIPSNAQVRTVPVSDLPPVIKKQLFTSSANSSTSSGLPSVVYVSPVTTVNQSPNPPSNSAPGILSKTSNMTLSSSGGAKPHLRLIPKVSQRPNSPIKWAIEEEEDGVRASSIDALISPSVSSEILRAVAEREVANKRSKIMTKEMLVSPSSVAKSEKGLENALVMYNGKVFFVAKKCSQPFQLRGEEAAPSTAATKSYQVKTTSIRSPQNSPRQDDRIIIPDEADEVIDLCNDDCPDDSSQQAASGCMSTLTHLDEDNVIFVSYIPPQSESGLTRNVIRRALEKETDQTGTRSSDIVTQPKSLDGATSPVSELVIGSSTLGDHLASDGRDGRPSGKPGPKTLVSKDKNVTKVCGAAVMETNNNRASTMNRQQSTSTQQLDSMEVDLETETGPSTSDSSSGICSQIGDTCKMESSTEGTFSQAPQPCHVANHLREIFGITAVVKICLQRIDEVSAGAVPEEVLQNESVEDVQKTNGLKEKEFFLQDLHNPQETESNSDLISVKRGNVLTEQELSGELVTPGLHADITPITCSFFKHTTNTLSTLKSKYPSGQSSHKGILCDVESEPVISYVEPIDDDLPSADENDIPNSQDSAARPQIQTCVNPNTRRMGRARKRTMCPCCIPGALGPTVKSSARLEEPQRWAWTTEQTSRKGGRTKARRNDRKTPGRINYVTAENKQSCKASYKVPARDGLCAAFMDSDELKQQEQTK